MEEIEEIFEENESESSITHASGSDTGDTEDFYTKFNMISGWQSLVLLQFESHMTIAIILGVYIAYVNSVIDMAIGLGTNNTILTDRESVPNKVLYVYDFFYFIDFISMLIYKNINWERAGLLYKPRHGIILLMEFLTIIPWAQIYSVVVDKPYSQTFYILKLRYALRLCRFYCLFETLKEYVDEYSHVLHLIVYMFFLSLLVVTFGCISYIYDCKVIIGDCKRDYDLLGKYMYSSGVNFFMVGTKSSVESSVMNGVHFSLVPYIMNTYFLSYFIVDILQTIRMKFRHMAVFEWLKRRIVSWRLRYKKDWRSFHIKYEHIIEDFAPIIWKRTKGYIPSLYLDRVLPAIVYKELSLDMSWAALKHSHLFRHEEVFFLRAISSVMEHRCLCPGEIIYNRNKFKTSMIYVVSGVVDILSEEDGETPILSLTSGACLGEAVLVISLQSACTLVAKTISDVSFLRRKDFLQLSEQYPEKIRSIRKEVFKRVKSAENYRKLSLYQQRMQNASERIGVVTMRWLQLTLRKLLSTNLRSGDVYDKYYLQSLEENIFCSKYLDMLVKAQDIHLVSDSVFVRNKFPFIFKPDSILLKTWNVGVIIVVVALSIAYPYYVIFSESITAEYTILNILVTCIWTVDLYIKSSTIVQDKYILYTEVSDIMIYNLKNVSYIIDVLCIIPTEMFLYFIIGPLDKTMAIPGYCNRLLKFYRIEVFYQNVRLNMFTHVILKYVKYGIYMILITYYTAAILYVIGIGAPNEEAFEQYLNSFSVKTTFDTMFICISSAITFFGNMDIIKFPYIGGWDACIRVALLQMGSFVFFIYFVSFAAAAHTLTQDQNDKIMDFLRDTDVTMKCFNINKNLQKRVWCYVSLQLQVTDIYFLLGRQLISSLPKDLQIMTLGIAIGDLIRHQQLFFELNDRILSEICYVSTVHVLPSMEIIKNAGEVCTELHILTNGQCLVTCINGQSKTVLPGECFSVLECALNIPSMVTVRALTHCKIVSVKFNVFKSILLRWPQEYQAFQDTVSHFNILEITERIKHNSDVTDGLEMVEPKELNIKSFGYGLKKRTKKYYTFHEGFPPWAFIFKYFLLRYTFYCNGKFVFYWEITRCIFVLMTCFIFPFTILHKTQINSLYFLISFFDLTAYADIYLRQHFTYYNEHGIEVTHPFKTALFYWKHSFVIDLLGCLPLFSISQQLFPLKHDMPLFLNRIIQLYRVQGMKKYIFRKTIRVKNAFALLTYLPFLIIACNVIGAWVFITICKVDGYNAVCAPNTWIGRKLAKQSEKYEVYSYVMLFTIAGMVYNSFGIINVETLTELTWFVASIFLGIFIHTCLIALVVSSSFSINRDLVSYQEAMQQLVKFLSYRKIDKNIKNEIVNHFEYMWYKKKGKSIQTAFSPFKTSFKVEALYYIYGSMFKQSSIFPEPNQAFIRSLLLDVKHEIYLKTGILYSVNDINGDIFFLLKGRVEVVGADLNKLLTLKIGSVFGNLDDCPLGRRTLTMVASGHVEVLKISSSVFYSHLSKFPFIKRHFKMLTIFNVDFLEEKHQTVDIKRTTFDVEIEPKKKVRSLMPKKKRRKVFVKNKFILFWEDVILNIIYFSNYIFELYHISTGDDSLVVTLSLYTFDFFYIIKIYFKFHTTFENEFGQVIDDYKQIAGNYMRDHFGFYFDISTIIPFELISFVYLESSYHRFIWAACRVNRLSRVALLFKYLSKHSQMLNINVFAIKTIFLLVKIILSQITLGAFVALIRAKPSSSLKRLYSFLDSVMMITNSCSKFPFDLTTFKINKWNAIAAIILVSLCKYITWYFIAQTCGLLYVVNFTRSNYEEFIIFMKRYMENEDISVPLAKQITIFTKLLWSKTRGDSFPRLFNEAPYYLKEAVLNSMFGFHLLEHPLLKHCHKDLMRQMTSHMKTALFFPGATVVYAGDIDNTMYFIHEGEIKVLSEDTMCSEVVEEELHDGDMFGLDQGLYERRGHEYTYRVIKYCVLITLKREDWIYLLDFFPASKRVIYDRSELR